MDDRQVYLRDEEYVNVPTYVNRRLSWGAIIAGAVVSLALLAAFGFLGMALGMAAISPGQSVDTLAGMTLGAGIFGLISAFVAFLVGGWVASRLSATSSRSERWLHGFATWGISTIALVGLLGTAGGVMFSGGMSVIGDSMRFSSSPSISIGAADNASGTTGISASIQTGNDGVAANNTGASTTVRLTDAQMREAAAKTADIAAVAAAWTFAAQLLSLLAVTIGVTISGTTRMVAVPQVSSRPVVVH